MKKYLVIKNNQGDILAKISKDSISGIRLISKNILYGLFEYNQIEIKTKTNDCFIISPNPKILCYKAGINQNLFTSIDCSEVARGVEGKIEKLLEISNENKDTMQWIMRTLTYGIEKIEELKLGVEEYFYKEE